MTRIVVFFLLLALASVSRAAGRVKCPITKPWKECPRCIEYVEDKDGCITCECVGKPGSWGDIKLTDQTTSNIEYMLGIRKSRASYKTASKWTNIPSGDLYHIPFVLDGSLSGDAFVGVLTALGEIEAHTCLKFTPRTTETDYISFQGDQTGCWSYIGRIGGKQEISVDSNSGCQYKGKVLHSVVHALGFYHENVRADRNKYIWINWWNIQSGRAPNFYRLTHASANYYGTKYDKTSIMHEAANAYSDNGAPTIVDRDGSAYTEHQSSALSESDIYQINRMYSCKE